MYTLLYSFILNMIDIGTIFFAVSRFTESRLKYKCSRVVVWVLTSFIAAVIVKFGEKPFSAITSTFIILCIILCLYKKCKVSLTFFVLYLILMSLAEMVSVSIMSAILQMPFHEVSKSYPVMANFTVIGSKFIILIVGVIIFWLNRSARFISNMVTIFQMALTTSIIFMLGSLFSTFYYTTILGKNASMESISISIISLIIFLILVFILFYKMQIDAKKDKEFALKEQYEIMSQAAIEQLSAMIEKNLNLRHDLRKQLNVMYQLKETSESESAAQLYDEIEQVIQEYEKSAVLTDKPVIASVLLYFQNLSKTNNFKFTCHVPESLTVNISLNDFSGVLINILENAKNAIMQMSEGRYIDLKITEHKNALRIVCRNPYLGPKKNIWNIKPSDNHGRGLKNVQATAACYNGFVEIKNDNNIFEIQIDMFGKILE